nr:hypothetical protein [Paludibacteraceae bacterium]
MKRLGIILTAALVLLSCQQKDAEFRRVAYGDPIMPIRLMSDSTEVYLTDYLPSLDLTTLGAAKLTDGFDGLKADAADAKLMLYGNPKEVGVLTFDHGGSFKIDIPILPNMPVRQGLTTLGITDDMLFLEVADELKPLHFRCFLQNRALGSYVMTLGADGHYLFDLKSLKPGIKGRSYLRIYAWNEDCLLNDLLIPLQDGYPVLSADQLTRHDPNAQV